MKITWFAAFVTVNAAAIYENLPDASNFANVEQWAKGLSSAGEKQFNDFFGNNALRMPSPDEWSDHPVYQIMPDRFNNGDASNDGKNMPSWQRDQLNSGNLYSVPTYRHGGDIKGIINRLDYLADLGIETIFMTSMFYNEGGMYHGYCVSNPLQIDPGFGTLEDLQLLVREAHQRGMRIVLDFVINHMCNEGTKYKFPINAANKDKCEKGHYDNLVYGRNNPVQGQTELEFGDTFFPPLRDQRFFSRCGEGAWVPDGHTPASVAMFGDFSSTMFDFNTANRDVWFILAEIAKYWIAAADIDGYRLDAVKHVSENVIAYFSTHVRDYALSLGKDNYFIIGEIIDGDDLLSRYYQKMNTNPETPNTAGYEVLPSTQALLTELKDIYLKHPKQKYGGLTSVYDFPQSWDIRRIFTGQQNNFVGYLQNINNRRIWSDGEELNNWVFFDLHDIERLLETRDSGISRNNPNHLIGALSYINLAKGTPLLYYGDEQGFNSNCDESKITVGNVVVREQIKTLCRGDGRYEPLDSLHRQTMFSTGGFNLASAVPGVSGLARIGKPLGVNPYTDWRTDPFLNRNNEIYQALRAINRVRKSCAPLRRGAQWLRPNNNGIISFGRIYNNQEIVVFVNPTSSSRAIPDVFVDYFLHPQSQRFMFRNVLSQTRQTGFTGAKQSGTFIQFENKVQLAPYRAAIFVREDLIVDSWNEEAQAYLCKPELQSRTVATETNTGMPPMVIGAAAGAGALAVGGVALLVHSKRKNKEIDPLVAFRVTDMGEKGSGIEL